MSPQGSTREALELLFDTMRRAVDHRNAPGEPVTLQWDFTDAEPWHLRYIGPELARAYHDGGWHTLEEFFGIPGGDYAALAALRTKPSPKGSRRKPKAGSGSVILMDQRRT